MTAGGDTGVGRRLIEDDGQMLSGEPTMKIVKMRAYVLGCVNS